MVQAVEIIPRRLRHTGPIVFASLLLPAGESEIRDGPGQSRAHTGNSGDNESLE